MKRFFFGLLLFALLFGCLPVEPPLERPQTGVYGRLSSVAGEKGQLWVYAYRSARGNFRGPAEFAARAEEDGRYLLDLLPGQWYLIARSRVPGNRSGPPRSGEAFASYPQNPLQLQPGQVARIDLHLLPAAKNLLRGNRVFRGDTGFRGRLLDPAGKPVVGAVALAYRGRDFHRMPDYISTATDASGQFTLYVPAAGRYCLLARESSRGQPRQGELFGQLDRAEQGCRPVAAGQLLDVGVIHLKPFLR